METTLWSLNRRTCLTLKWTNTKISTCPFTHFPFKFQNRPEILSLIDCATLSSGYFQFNQISLYIQTSNSEQIHLRTIRMDTQVFLISPAKVSHSFWILSSESCEFLLDLENHCSFVERRIYVFRWSWMGNRMVEFFLFSLRAMNSRVRPFSLCSNLKESLALLKSAFFSSDFKFST